MGKQTEFIPLELHEEHAAYVKRHPELSKTFKRLDKLDQDRFEVFKETAAHLMNDIINGYMGRGHWELSHPVNNIYRLIHSCKPSNCTCSSDFSALWSVLATEFRFPHYVKNNFPRNNNKLHITVNEYDTRVMFETTTIADMHDLCMMIQATPMFFNVSIPAEQVKSRLYCKHPGPCSANATPLCFACPVRRPEDSSDMVESTASMLSLLGGFAL